MPIGKRVGAEFLGSLVLVLGGCGAALTSPTMSAANASQVGIALAFGLTFAAMAFALGHVSGAHFNPAVTLGMYVGRRFPGRDVMPYMIAQIAGAIFGAAALFVIARGKGSAAASLDFFANGFGDLSPGGYSIAAVMIAEVVLTFSFVLVVVATSDRRSLTATSPIAAGAALAMVHMVGLPIDGGSFNPARSVATAFVQGERALEHLWLFVLAPLVGGSLAGVVVPLLSRNAQAISGEGA